MEKATYAIWAFADNDEEFNYGVMRVETIEEAKNDILAMIDYYEEVGVFEYMDNAKLGLYIVNGDKKMVPKIVKGDWWFDMKIEGALDEIVKIEVEKYDGDPNMSVTLESAREIIKTL